MVGNMKKLGIKLTVLTFLSAIVFGSLFIITMSASACGCGMVVVGDESSKVGWSYSDDFTETSFINYQNKTEKLIISLDIQSRSNDAVLIVPIPAEPSGVKADVLTDTPSLEGYNVTDKAKEKLSDIRDGVLATQIYPAIPKIISTLMAKEPESGLTSINAGLVSQSLSNGAAPDNTVTVYQHLEKNGMVAEVLTASNSSALYDYLSQKGLKVEKDSIPIIRDYISSQFSFVVSWISPTTSYVNARGLQINFPSNKIYYPLKPGSVYSGPGLEKAVYIIGYISPNLYADIKPTTKVDYFYSDEATTFQDFYSSKGAYGYTRLVLNTEPKNLTKDLYMSKRAPIKILNAQAINLYTLIYGFVLLIITALLAVYLACRIVLPSYLRNQKTIVKLWLFSCFTIIGTVVGAHIILPREKRIRFSLAYSLMFVVIVLVFWFLSAHWYG
jgi:hypothetical protein